MEAVPELLLIDKPAGITSFDVIRKLRRKLGVKKMGHAGTLDPLATGLMIIGVGPGTKKLSNLIKLDKEYVAEIVLGESRTTSDQEGEIVAEAVIDESLDTLRGRVAEVLNNLIGDTVLPVSAYSAIKVGGVPMYKKARQAAKQGGVVSEVPKRVMTVHEAELESIHRSGERVIVTVRFLVGSGTYIRSLAEEIGRQLSHPACLMNLRRTKVGEFSLAEATHLDTIH